jgi:hypothetical protein
MNDIVTAVTDLLKDSYAYIPVDTILVTNAQKAAQRLMRTIGSDNRWCITRPQEDEPDLGVISKTKREGYDEKSYFHYAIDLTLYAPKDITKQQKACLRVIDKLYGSLKGVSHSVVTELVKRERLSIEHASDALIPFRHQQPYNTSALRFLHYPDVPEQTGAKAHFDRSFLTIHLGDEGGELYIQDAAGDWILASPPQGMALVFFGVKALYASNGVLKPLRHKSTTEAGKIRTAAVLFAHIELPLEVRNAQKAYEAFCATSV